MFAAVIAVTVATPVNADAFACTVPEAALMIFTKPSYLFKLVSGEAVSPCQIAFSLASPIVPIMVATNAWSILPGNAS